MVSACFFHTKSWGTWEPQPAPGTSPCRWSGGASPVRGRQGFIQLVSSRITKGSLILDESQTHSLSFQVSFIFIPYKPRWNRTVHIGCPIGNRWSACSPVLWHMAIAARTLFAIASSPAGVSCRWGRLVPWKFANSNDWNRRKSNTFRTYRCLDMARCDLPRVSRPFSRHGHTKIGIS